MLVHGAIIGTMPRDEAFHFARAGTFIERADNVARLLDIKYYLLLPSLSYVGSSLDTGQWDSILRAVSGDRAYRWLNTAQIDARGIVEFLVFDPRFPRSLSYCRTALREHLDAIARIHGREGASHAFDARGGPGARGNRTRRGIRARAAPFPARFSRHQHARRACHRQRLPVPGLMRLAIRHTTNYRFERPVVHAIQRLRLTPKSTQGQEIVDWDMQFDNAERQFAYEDQHHNTNTLVAIIPGTQDVTITCSGTVDTHDFAGVIGRHAGHLPLWSFRGQTALTKPGAGMRTLVREIRKTDLGPLDMLHALSARILDKVAYETGATGVETTAEDALAEGRGVCQDHSQIFIGTARALGIPARYVSGYLMMDDRINQEATHAWAEAHVEDLGWVGFDVSNGISPDQRYVRLATGRDYRDAAPITGISLGSASEELAVSVAVEQKQVQQ